MAKTIVIVNALPGYSIDDAGRAKLKAAYLKELGGPNPVLVGIEGINIQVINIELDLARTQVAQITSGIKSVNEVRDELGLPPVVKLEGE